MRLAEVNLWIVCLLITSGGEYVAAERQQKMTFNFFFSNTNMKFIPGRKGVKGNSYTESNFAVTSQRHKLMT